MFTIQLGDQDDYNNFRELNYSDYKTYPDLQSAKKALKDIEDMGGEVGRIVDGPSKKLLKYMKDYDPKYYNGYDTDIAEIKSVLDKGGLSNEEQRIFESYARGDYGKITPEEFIKDSVSGKIKWENIYDEADAMGVGQSEEVIDKARATTKVNTVANVTDKVDDVSMEVTEKMKQKALDNLEKLKALKQQEEAYAGAKGIGYNPYFIKIGERQYSLTNSGDIQKFEELIKQGAIELNKQDAELLVKIKEQAMIDMGFSKQEQVKTAVSPKKNKIKSEAEKEFDEMFDDTYTKDVSKADDVVDDVAKAADKADDVVDTVTDVAKAADKADDVVDTVTDEAKARAAANMDKVQQAKKTTDIIDPVEDAMLGDYYESMEGKIDKADDAVDAVKAVDKADDVVKPISKAAMVKNYIMKNPKVGKVLQNKWTKLGGKAVMPVTVAYTALKDFEGFNEGSVDFSGNTFQDIGELAEEGTRSALDMGGKFVLNTAEDAVELGDTILKGLAWGLGQMGDIGNEATKFFSSDKTREEIKKNEVDYSTMFMKAINDLGLSDKYKKESNKTKAGLNALLYGKDGFDDDVYQRTLDKYNKKLEPEDELIDSNADDSGIELGDITPDPKKEAMLVQKDTQSNVPKAYQDRQIVKNPDGTFKYLSHQTGDYKDTDEVTGEKLTTLDQVKKQIDKGLTQDYAYRAKKAGDKTEAKKILDDAKVRGYTEDDIGISIF